MNILESRNHLARSGRPPRQAVIALGLVFMAVLTVSGVVLQDGKGTSKAAGNVVTVEDTSRGSGLNQFQYTGTWTRCAGCSVKTSNSSYYYTPAIGSSVTLRFNGTQATLFGIKEKVGGISSVSIDGGAATTFDTYAAKSVLAAVYSTPILTPGTHTMVVTNTKNRNTSATGNVLAIDRAEITPGPNAVLYGKAGTFGTLAGVLPTGQSLKTNAVTNWEFAAGDSEFFSALAPNGEIVLGSNPQTDNEAYPTADHMNIGVFNPAQNLFRNITVPTNTGAAVATNPFFSVGGASVDSIVPIAVGGTPRIAFISAVPYSGWDTTKYGEYPTLGYLDVANNSLGYNPALSRSASQIFAKGGLSAAACPQKTNIFNQKVASCRGLAEMGVLPLSQKLVASQYFPDVASNQQSGRIIVLNTDGSVAASYTYPNIPNPAGGFFTVNPREVDVDPTSTGNLEYFTVIFDVAAGTVQSDFPMQEFVYNRSTNQITPASLPFLSGQKSTTGKAYRFETAKYDSFGNLWATQAVSGALSGGPMVVYTKTSGVRKLETTCKAPAGWNGASWASVCSPNKTASGTESYGQTRSLTEDPTSHTMFAATLSGYLMRVKQSGNGTNLALTTLPPVNMGLDQLVDRNTHYIGIRKGVVDTTNRALYIPVIQTYNATDCPTWPTTTPCTPKTLDQWLYRFDLSALSL